MPIKQLDGQEIRRIFGGGSAWLERHAAYVNSLNVFPVPDGDSGTNMLLTMQAAMHEVEHSPAHSAGEICAALARGALLGARGNSGVILSQIIRGFSRSVDGKKAITTADFGAAMVEGSKTAYKGVVKPVEGTILTVIREAAETAARAARQSDDFVQVMDRTVETARAAVQKTPDLLAVLREAGVVDAGGQGLLLILEGASKYLKGESLEPAAAAVSAENLGSISREEGWGYDIQFHIRGRSLNVDAIRDRIAGMGESTLVVGDENLVKVHVHALNPGEIVKYGAEQGALVNIIIENMQEQYIDFLAGHTADQRVGAENMGGANLPAQMAAPKPEEIAGIATIAVAPGSGLQRIFESLGVGAMVAGGPTMNPSTKDLVEAINSVKADKVVILPNDKNIILAANQAVHLTDKRVEVVPTRTVPQGIAALLAFNYQADLETNARNMSAAAQRMRTVELTKATRSVRLNGLEVREGQFIGLLDGELAAAGDGLLGLTTELLHRADAGSAEILTIYYGDSISPGEAEKTREVVQSEFPAQAIEIYPGGQPLYPYIISVE